jgi:hypothetical protein
MNTELALPILAASVAVFMLIGIWVGAREPPEFWMDERRLPKRQLRRRNVGQNKTTGGETRSRPLK